LFRLRLEVLRQCVEHIGRLLDKQLSRIKAKLGLQRGRAEY